MKKAVKWLLIVGGALFVLVIAALLIIPMFVNVEHFKPQIEKLVSDATGRPFKIGGSLDLSLFPWAGVAFSDLHFGNPPGFQEKDMVTVKSFEVRAKLFPLLSRDLQVKRFVLDEPRIVLEKTKDGRNNLEGIGRPAQQAARKSPEEKGGPSEGKPLEGLPIKTLDVGEFAIKNASLVLIDHAKGTRQEITKANLRLEDVSLDRPIQLALSAQMLGQPVSIEGHIGPVGSEPGKGTVPLALVMKALGEIKAEVQGTITDLSERQQFDLALEVTSFSPRKVLAAMGQALPVQTADPDVLNACDLKVKLKGNPQSVSISEGSMGLDDSRFAFSADAKDFAAPQVRFNLDLDKIDLDRYLPAAGEKGMGTEAEKKTELPKTAQKKADYAPLRRLVLDGSVKVGELKAHGVKIQDLYLKVSGRNGRFLLDPLTLKLYDGDLSGVGRLDVQQGLPKTHFELNAQGIQAGPLLRDVLGKDFLEGMAKARVTVDMIGDDAENIKQSLNGKGDLLFTDGAVKGIDLPGMVRNAQAAFGLAEKGEKPPKTDFSELHAPFTITNGVVNTPETSLMSPLLRVTASGDADLVKEALDFRVEPKFVATLKGQEDTMAHSGVMVPVLVTGSFSSPRFRPDLKGMLKKGLEEGLPQPSELKKLLPSEGTKEGASEALEEKAKDLMKGLPLGR